MGKAKWRATLALIVVLPALILLIVETFFSSGSNGPKVVTRPVIAGSVHVVVAKAGAGIVVSATISLRADRPVHLESVRVQLRDAAGRPSDSAGRGFDLPASGSVELGPRPRTLRSAGLLYETGPFSYVLAYRVGQAWRVLPPYDTITVG